jgi:hypothetical protein
MTFGLDQFRAEATATDYGSQTGGQSAHEGILGQTKPWQGEAPSDVEAVATPV